MIQDYQKGSNLGKDRSIQPFPKVDILEQWFQTPFFTNQIEYEKNFEELNRALKIPDR